MQTPIRNNTRVTLVGELVLWPDPAHPEDAPRTGPHGDLAIRMLPQETHLSMEGDLREHEQACVVDDQGEFVGLLAFVDTRLCVSDPEYGSTHQVLIRQPMAIIQQLLLLAATSRLKLHGRHARDLDLALWGRLVKGVWPDGHTHTLVDVERLEFHPTGAVHRTAQTLSRREPWATLLRDQRLSGPTLEGLLQARPKTRLTLDTEIQNLSLLDDADIQRLAVFWQGAKNLAAREQTKPALSATAVGWLFSASTGIVRTFVEGMHYHVPRALRRDVGEFQILPRKAVPPFREGLAKVARGVMA